MPRPKLHVVGQDEVKIIREGDTAIFTYADKKMGNGMSLKIGPKIKKMTDEELLELHNETVRSMEASRREYNHIAVEIPAGKPQIEYDKRYGQWAMRGDVLRCSIGDTGLDDHGFTEPEIEIDDQKLSWTQFGRMLTTFAGWSMRLVIVPDDELQKIPDIKVMESRDTKFKNRQ
jgi:hypothetical protein